MNDMRKFYALFIALCLLAGPLVSVSGCATLQTMDPATKVAIIQATVTLAQSAYDGYLKHVEVMCQQADADELARLQATLDAANAALARVTGGKK